MQMNDSLHLSDVELTEGVEFTATAYQEGDDPTVAIITEKKVIEEEVPEEAEEDEVGADGTEADSEPDAVDDDKGGE
jgi:hypothetical protein